MVLNKCAFAFVFIFLSVPLPGAHPGPSNFSLPRAAAPGGIQHKEGSTIEYDDPFESRSENGVGVSSSSSGDEYAKCVNGCQKKANSDNSNCWFFPDPIKCILAVSLDRDLCIKACERRKGLRFRDEVAHASR